MSDQTWRKVFVGREKELDLLKDAWEQTKNNAPQFITFLAETGIGKTRLVQHFYTWLNEQEDPNDYWPDTLEFNGQSLAVNPVFPEKSGHQDIPWLWWGLRASDPTGRNQQNSMGSAIHDALPRLEPHVEPIALKRYKNDLNKKTAKSAAMSIANLASLGWFEPVLSVYDHVKTYQEEKKRQQAEKRTVAEVAKQKEAGASQLIFDYIRTILNKADNDAVTVPVILILDDAQWMDATSLSFVEKLWQAAKRADWPLLIIATHWLREWRQYGSEEGTTSAIEMPSNLVDLIRRNANDFSAWEPCELKRIDGDGLNLVLAEALPGLKKKQQEIILDRVNGNPQFLDDLILWMQENPRKFFVQRDRQLSLTTGGENLVTSIGKGNKGHLSTIRKRFEDLEEDMRDLLGFGSYQGMRFVEPLILEVVQQLYSEDDCDWQAYLKKAIDPYTVINRINDVANEFRQRNVFEVAKEHLSETDEEGFKEILLNILCQWFESGRIADHALTEQEALLTLLISELERSKEDGAFLLRVQMSLVEIYNNSHRASDAANLTLKIIEHMPDDGWKLDELSFNNQNTLAIILLEFTYNDEAIQLYNKLLIHMYTKNMQDNAWENNLAAAHMNRGMLLARDPKHTSSALSDYKDAVDILQQLWNERGEQFTHEWKNNLATALMNRGILLARDPNNTAAALSDYQDAVEIRQRLRDEMGKQFPHVWRNDLAKAQVNRGNLLSDDPDNTAAALSDYQDAVEIRQQLRKKMGEQFPPAWKNVLAQALMKRGLLLARDPSHTAAALSDFQDAVEIRQQLQDEMGEQFPHAWKNDLAHAHMNRGTLLARDPRHTSAALSDFQDAVKIRKQLRDAMGEKFHPVWRNDLAAAHMNRGNLLSHDPNHASEVPEDYQAALDILQQLQDEMGEQFPSAWKNDLAMCSYNFGCFLIESDEKRACALFPQAFHLGGELYRQFGNKMPIQWMQVFQSSQKKCKQYHLINFDK
jgi:tetratricopeptide (TPR) repeat protein